VTRTIRIYNKPVIKKAQRYNLDGDDIHPLFGCYLSYPVGIPYTRRSWICMGHCPQCRDKNREPSLIRKRNKEQFMFELRLESPRTPL